MILVKFLLAAVLLSTTHTIQPVCFNCQCSNYDLDTSIQCKDAVLDKSTAYFTLKTKNVTVAVGSDVMLAVELKEDHDEYCWCTDARIEWNALHPNSSGRLLVILMNNASKIETGHYWAVLYLNEKFYFANPLYLNVTGKEELVPSPPLEADPKMGALVVAVLVVTIMVLGLCVYCLQIQKRKRRHKKQRRNFNNAMHDLEATEARMPLNWELQDPPNYVPREPESDTEPAEQPPHHQLSDIDDGAASSNSTNNSSDVKLEDVKQSSSITSSDTSTKDTEEVPTIKKENVKSTRSTPQGRKARASPNTRRRKPRSLSPSSPSILRPVTDDRFSTERSWYKSLNTEIISGSLLKDPDIEIKREEKKRRKSLAKASSENIAAGILRSGDVGAGLAGSTSILHQEQLDHIKQLYQTLTKDFRYGRSLPTPQPAGRRPTVMTLFPVEHNHHIPRATATIHCSNPNRHRRVQSLFKEIDDKTRSVTFSEKNLTKSFSSIDDITTSRSNKSPRKSNLKNNKIGFDDIVEADGRRGTRPASDRSKAPTERSRSVEELERKSQGSDSGHESEPSSTTDKKVPCELNVPELGLIPASPTTTSPATPSKNRFTVIPISSKEGSLESIQDITDHQHHQSDPLLIGQWNFSDKSSDSENLINNSNVPHSRPRQMDRLTVPGMFDLEGYWSN